MADKVPSLGDGPPASLRRLQETYPLPKTRRELVTAFEHILSLGGVNRVVVELGAPIKVTRLTPTNGMEDVPEELQDDDFFSSARNAPMEEFVFAESILPTNYLLRAFHILSQRRLKARVILVNRHVLLREWLGLDKSFDVAEIFGVEVRGHKEIPETALLLVAGPFDDPDLITFSLKMELVTGKKP